MNATLRRLIASSGPRFLLAGGMAAAFTWAVRFPLSTVLPFAAAVATAQILIWGVGFTLYRTLVFAPSGRPLAREMLIFAAVNAASLACVLTVTLMLAAISRSAGFGGPAAEAAAHAGGIAAGAVMNFLGHRRFTFAAAAARCS